MTLDERIKLQDDEHYSNILSQIKETDHQPILIGLGGSHSYGTNTPDSDVDIRGVYLNSTSELLGITPDNEQYVTSDPDLAMYSLKKAVWLMKECNPAMIEILSCRDEDYLYLSPEGKLLRQNVHLFFSKKAEKTFGGYAKSQLNRLVNRSGRAKNMAVQNEERSLEKCFMTLAARCPGYVNGSAAVRHDEEEKIYVDFAVKDMPIANFPNLLNEFNSIDKSYRKSTRNDKATTRGKLAKHMMHLIRLYIMGAELLSTGQVHTYREKEHDLLMSIRNGEYLEEDGVTPTKSFEKLLAEHNKMFVDACDRTKLPDEPDLEAINKLVIEINKRKLGRS